MMLAKCKVYACTMYALSNTAMSPAFIPLQSSTMKCESRRLADCETRHTGRNEAASWLMCILAAALRRLCLAQSMLLEMSSIVVESTARAARLSLRGKWKY